MGANGSSSMIFIFSIQPEMIFPEEREGLSRRNVHPMERASRRRCRRPWKAQSRFRLISEPVVRADTRLSSLVRTRGRSGERQGDGGRGKKGLDIPGSSLGAELFRGVAARIKASCGIKNLCNQLSNLLPHISRPMSRHHRLGAPLSGRDLPTLSLDTF